MWEKAHLMCQVGIGKMIAVRSVETNKDVTETGAYQWSRDGVWRVPVYWPGGDRHIGDMSPVRLLSCGTGESVPRYCRSGYGRREGASQAAETVRD